MTNWMQLFGVTLILVHICISSGSATRIAGARVFDDSEFRRVPESQSRRKTRRMMMGLGSEMGWEYGVKTGPGNSHLKRGESPASGKPVSKSDSFRDSVIVLRNHKRSVGQPASGPAAGSSKSKSDSFRDSVIVLRNHKRSVSQAASGPATAGSKSKSDSFRDSVIVLRNHKRSDGQDALPRSDARQPDIVLKDSRMSQAPTSNSAVRNPTSVLKQHKRSGPASPKPSVSDSSIVLKSQQQPANTAASQSSVQDSTIVLRNHKRAEEGEGAPQPKIVLMDPNASKGDSVSERALRGPNDKSSGSTPSGSASNVSGSVIVLKKEQLSQDPQQSSGN
ncbi:hypothetical protein PGTUg99_017253 [Puccinia graminis f. sp. tritici]|uniref:Uncharacterized protein n=1 Tax=Puccinia graminis f. sp. tritici TaxID=56615 RepID=A0A5B0RHI8_PUCGR|nr:hypothetical protein PGTUg99_017253 [Puccinia graminis f. sp. tritici]